MIKRGSRTSWRIALPALALCVALVSLTVLAWRGRAFDRRRSIERRARALAGLQAGTGRADKAHVEVEPIIPHDFDPSTVPWSPRGLDDPRLRLLRRAGESWRRSAGPRRTVIDQVCLVDDEPGFLAAIAAWDERHFFPILIDRPAWVLPFLRAFRPARVVRYARRRGSTGPATTRESPASADAQEARWRAALEAVARAWTGAAQPAEELAAGGAPPRRLGATPPGVVLSEPSSPMLAGAVALAAGRFEPLVRLEPHTWSSGTAGAATSATGFHDVLDAGGAWEFARRVEVRVAALLARYNQLGDDCDFLTLAGDWPYRYTVAPGDEPAGGFYALDDLIGRHLDRDLGRGWLQRTRRRWGFTGRLLGDPAASVARAMGALFLQPSSSLLWNTYGGGEPWSLYDMSAVAGSLSHGSGAFGAVMHRAGRQADLASWHRVVGPANRFGLVLLNSSGGPWNFTIRGGPGRPGDLPRGFPAAVAMIHSHSASNPVNFQTIAGRWLAGGAFVYYGSVDEPFLLAFRPPQLVAELMSAGIPMVAALRQGEAEPYGQPWRLVYLGDPLYRLQPSFSPDEPAQAMSQAEVERPVTRPATLTAGARYSALDRQETALESAQWPSVELRAPLSGDMTSQRPPDFDSEGDRLAWCLDAAIVDLTAAPSAARPGRSGGTGLARSISAGAHAWRSVLREIHRERLEARLRPVFDELLIDTLQETGSLDELQARLARLPAGECSPLVWQAIETCAVYRLARLEDQDSTLAFNTALGIWDEVIRLSWPSGWEFPAQFTERLAALASLDEPRRLGVWHERLRQAALAFAPAPQRPWQAAVVAAEEARVSAKLGRKSAGR